MKLRFQADADLDGRVIRGLRRAAPGIDIQSAATAGIIGRSDPEVLQLASDTARVLVSQDRRTMPEHFRAFISSNASPGVILLRRGFTISAAIDDLVLIWSASHPAEMENRLLWIPL